MDEDFKGTVDIVCHVCHTCRFGLFQSFGRRPRTSFVNHALCGILSGIALTYTASVLISPAGVSRIRFTTVFVVITFMVVLLAAFKVFLPVAFRVVWALAVVAYCIVLGIHTIMFRELSLVAKNISKTFTTKMWTIT